MYKPLIVILCFFPSVHIACFMLCVLCFVYFVYFIDIQLCNSVRSSYGIKSYLLIYTLSLSFMIRLLVVYSSVFVSIISWRFILMPWLCLADDIKGAVMTTETNGGNPCWRRERKEGRKATRQLSNTCTSCRCLRRLISSPPLTLSPSSSS